MNSLDILKTKFLMHAPIVIDAISQKIDSATSKLQPIGISICGCSLVVAFIGLMIGKKLRDESKERIVWCVVGGVGIGMTVTIVGWITGI